MHPLFIPTRPPADCTCASDPEHCKAEEHAMGGPINHPSYMPTGPIPQQEVATAINESIETGTAARCRYTDRAAEILAEECEVELEDEYTFHGRDLEGRAWTVMLVE